MNIKLCKYQNSDFPFLKEMLYEAVFWRKGPNTPSFEEGLELPDVKKAIDDFEKRDGDVAVVAFSDDHTPVGAAWLRYWNEKDSIRGFIAENIPVLVLGVKGEFRQQGIGSRLIEWLIDYSSEHSIQQISLCVSKDNHALDLYRKTGFIEFSDLDHSFNMVTKIPAVKNTSDF